jgi:hypothetical protein
MLLAMSLLIDTGMRGKDLFELSKENFIMEDLEEYGS